MTPPKQSTDAAQRTLDEFGGEDADAVAAAEPVGEELLTKAVGAHDSTIAEHDEAIETLQEQMGKVLPALASVVAGEQDEDGPGAPDLGGDDRDRRGFQ